MVRVSGLTLLVPFGLVLAVGVAATVGGAGTTGVGQLGQLFGGPGIPPATIGAPMPAERTGGLTPFSTLVPAVPVTASTPVRVPAVPRPSSQGPSGVVPRTRPAPRRRVVVPSPAPPQAKPSPAPPAAPPTTPPAPPPRPPSLIRQVGNELKRIVEPLPKPVGPVAADAVDTVIDLLDPSGGRPKPVEPVSQAVGSLLHRP